MNTPLHGTILTEYYYFFPNLSTFEFPCYKITVRLFSNLYEIRLICLIVDHTSMLFVKSELHCSTFPTLCDSLIFL